MAQTSCACSRVDRRGCLRLVGMLAVALIMATAQAEDRTPLRDISAPEARQGVAVDAAHVYAIDNTTIGKYNKFTGERVALWEAGEDTPLKHLNSGIVRDGQLICAHSNYGELPMASSVEIWDAETLRHIDTHSFGVLYGSLTWLDWHENAWWACFAHYEGKGGEPGKGPEHTVVVRMDEDWRPLESWLLPATVVERLAPHSASGGTWGTDGRLYITGHDRPELYVLALPAAGSVLRHVGTVPFPNEGQAIAADRTGSGLMYGITRKTRRIVAAPVGGPETD
jgi:hypothetical protein